MLSMTGFGSAAFQKEGIAAAVELKTVNNRFFKLALRINDNYAAFEPKIEALIREKIERGTINVTVKVRKEKSASDYKLNETALLSYFGQIGKVNNELGLGNIAPIRIDQLVTLPGVVEQNGDQDGDNETVWPVIEKALREALAGLQKMRQTEGDSMAADLKSNIENLRKSVTEVEKLAPEVAPNYRKKLTERIGKMVEEHGVILADGDFVREVALYADRCDISEETVRFRSHLEQFESAMATKDACGKKLDFLTQELFRETNTMGSKANDAEITRNVVEMKTIIERVREMVQNVE
jgi:uncharacterized protein (TIGR00255 family)